MVCPESSILEETPARVSIDSIKLRQLFHTDILNKAIDLLVWYQGKNRALKRGNQRRENKIGSLGFMCADAEAVFKNAINDSSNTYKYLIDKMLTERRLNNRRSILFFKLISFTSLKGNEIFIKLDCLPTR